MFKGHREKAGLMWRVGLMCEVLTKQYGVKISPSGYYAFKSRKPSCRSANDERLKGHILEVWEKNYSCWGVKKTWQALLKEGEAVARCTIERLMREMQIKGLVRGKAKRTTIAGNNAKNAEDLVRRNFYSCVPNRIWVADFTYVSTWEGWCYTALVTDVFARRILGWAVSARMNEELVASAFKMAVWFRYREGCDDFLNLIHHHDKGSQYTADGFFELLGLHGIRASIGSVGDSYDNALAETMIGGYKCTLINNPIKGPWKSLDQLESETAKWVHWHNASNITEYNNWKTPIEIERMLYTTGEDGRKCSQKAKA